MTPLTLSDLDQLDERWHWITGATPVLDRDTLRAILDAARKWVEAEDSLLPVTVGRNFEKIAALKAENAALRALVEEAFSVLEERNADSGYFGKWLSRARVALGKSR